VSSAFVTNKGDGLLGLSFGINNTVSPVPVATPVENMILQDDIPPSAELFTVWLGNLTERSFFTFGYIDSAALQGQTPTYTPIDNSRGAWQFDSSAAAINGSQIDRSGNKAIADTGTTLCLVSDSLREHLQHHPRRNQILQPARLGLPHAHRPLGPAQSRPQRRRRALPDQTGRLCVPEPRRRHDVWRDPIARKPGIRRSGMRFSAVYICDLRSGEYPLWVHSEGSAAAVVVGSAGVSAEGAAGGACAADGRAVEEEEAEEAWAFGVLSERELRRVRRV
jgi:hypothetical protein